MMKSNKSYPTVSAVAIQKIARSMLPFYTKVALNRKFAERFTTAVVNADLGLMEKLLSGIPTLANSHNYGTNGIGYFFSFPFPLSTNFYTNGTTIPPGIVQFTFNTKVHRNIARAVLPLYHMLATNRSFAEVFAKAIRYKNKKAISVMVRGIIMTKFLRSVTIEASGFALLFKYNFSKYPYRNLLFVETR
jgi:hypothetical protein